MHRTALALFGLALLTTACGNPGIPNATLYPDDSIPPVEASNAKSKHTKDAAQSEEELAFLDEMPDTEASKAPAVKRSVGDVKVVRFSGSFTKTPMTLTEEVTAQAGNLVVVDYTLDEGKKSTKLRVTFDAIEDRVLRVRQVTGKKEIPSTVQAYEAMLNKTMFVPDDNEEEIASEEGTCVVSAEELPCFKTSYRVKVGKETATFTVLRSPGIEGDVSGEITSGDKLFYRAEVVEMRSGMPAGVASR